MEDKKLLKLMSWPIRLPSTYFTGLLMINHPPVEGGFNIGWGKPYEKRDDDFILSLCDYFEERTKQESLETGSIVWGSIVPTHAEFIELLKNRDCEKLHEYFRFMFAKPLTFGLAQGEFFYTRLKKDDEEIQKNTGFAVYDKFLSLLEAVSVVPAFSPEHYQSTNEWLKYYSVPMDQYLDELEAHVGHKIQAPEYQGEHFGLQTERHGLFSDRDIMALGVAIRIMESYWNRKDISICDIGSGLGYLPFYLKQLGFENITHIDIPTVTVAAKYFMKTNMPDFDLKYITPSEFNGEYDLVINFDGLSTFNRKDAEDYANKISENAKHFLSINREIDDFRVCDIMNMNRITRNPFWYRRGYIEEDYVPRR
jgi:2-polyprenyl-3-methyl-5-hydroxy-6-metoxy-1,4-benzoquinol methylase